MKDSLLFKSLEYVYKEHKENKNRLHTLAVASMYQQTLRTSLGLGWVFLRDIIYFTAYVVFRYLMAGAKSIEGMNFIIFLMIGFIPWNFMGECIGSGVMAIKSSKHILSSLKFPISVMPTIEVMSIFLKRMFTLAILFVIILVFGDLEDVTLWLFIYYFASMFIFMCIWNLVFSSIIAISNDFEQLYRAGTSIIFFTIPVMWSFEIIKDFPWIIRFFKLNPIVYLIEGFRNSCYGGALPDLEYSIYFWGLSLLMLCVGSILQYKLKSHYIDVV